MRPKLVDGIVSGVGLCGCEGPGQTARVSPGGSNLGLRSLLFRRSEHPNPV